MFITDDDDKVEYTAQEIFESNMLSQSNGNGHRQAAAAANDVVDELPF
jgi:hypothetical protein